jgi:hypothetical protein
LPSTENGRLPLRRRQTGHRAPHAGIRRRAAVLALMEPGQRRREIISSAAVILAGVLVVIGFGVVASRAMQSGKTPANVPVPAAPALGGIVPPSSTGAIPLESPSASPSPSLTTAAPTTPPVSRDPVPDQGSIVLARGSVPATVDLSAEGSRDWVHWGEDGTFSLERDKDGGFTILEGAPTAPRFRHALSPQRFRWTGGDPVSRSEGTPTGIRTCGKDNGFTLSVPAGRSARTLRRGGLGEGPPAGEADRRVGDRGRHARTARRHPPDGDDHADLPGADGRQASVDLDDAADVRLRLRRCGPGGGNATVTCCDNEPAGDSR